ncbi:unnamed protein product [Penicillium viridicatum]
MTATFPHQSKDQQSAMEEIVDIVRQIGRQQGENVYFRTCYALFKHLQDKAEQASEDLLHLHQSGAFGFSDEEFYLVYQVAQELQVSVHDLADQALKAQLACEEFCELDPSYSAREAFKFTDTVQTAGKSEADASQGVCDSPRSMQFIMLPCATVTPTIEQYHGTFDLEKAQARKPSESYKFIILANWLLLI